MYRYFKITESEVKPLVASFKSSPMSSIVKNQVKTNLESFITECDPKYLNAEKIWDKCFPTLKDKRIFLSHSGEDRKSGMVPRFAEYLEQNFGVQCFIDYYFWDNISNLQNNIDKAYFEIGDNLYDYIGVTRSTAHVHALLSAALTKMIDQCECFIFVQSENSFSIDEVMEGTFSPWIFHEVNTVKMIKPKTPPHVRQRRLIQEGREIDFSAEDFRIKYPLNISDWLELYASDFEGLKGKKGDDFLNELYFEKSVQNKNLDFLDSVYEKMF